MLLIWLQKSKACAVQFHSHHTPSCRISSLVVHLSASCSLPRRYSVLGRAKFHPSDLTKLRRSNIAERQWGFKINLAHVWHNNWIKFPEDFLLSCSVHHHGGDDVRWKPTTCWQAPNVTKKRHQILVKDLISSNFSFSCFFSLISFSSLSF